VEQYSQIEKEEIEFIDMNTAITNDKKKSILKIYQKEVPKPLVIEFQDQSNEGSEPNEEDFKTPTGSLHSSFGE